MTPDQEIAHLLGALTAELSAEFHARCKEADPDMSPELKLEVLRQLIKESAAAVNRRKLN